MKLDPDDNMTFDNVFQVGDQTAVDAANAT
jgi:hypothetical protein